MHKPRIHPVPLTLSIVAMIFSVYSVYAVTDGFNFIGTETTASILDEDENDDEKEAEKEPVVVNYDEDLQEQVYAIIDQYIADQSAAAQAAAVPAPVRTDISMDELVDDDPMLGDPDAPVTIVEFSDYECPFCERFFSDTMPEIKANYIDEGLVNYVFRDYPLGFHQNALPAANAAACIGDQGGDEMYFAYHDILFENQSALRPDDLKEYAADFDIDQTQFATCVDDLEFKDEVEADMEAGMTYGVSGTPAFFVNGQFIEGALPYAAFEQAIEAALDEL